MKLKVDTGADICAVSIDGLQDFPFPVNIKKDDSILKGYGPGTLKDIGVADLKVTFRNKSINTKFNSGDIVVNWPENFLLFHQLYSELHRVKE